MSFIGKLANLMLEAKNEVAEINEYAEKIEGWKEYTFDTLAKINLDECKNLGAKTIKELPLSDLILY